MRAKRYNIFDFIHKAWRALLYETALVLQQTDFENSEESDKAIKQLELVLKTFASHAYHEDTFVIPAVEKFAPAVAKGMQGDHGKDEVLTHEMENKIEAFYYASSPEVKSEIGREIMYLFIEFVAFNLIHMNMEEHVINEVLWKNYTDEQLMAINKDIVKSVPGDEMMFSLQWMIKGISNMQLAQLLSNLRTEMPEDAFESVFYIARNSLPTQRWEEVKENMFYHV